MFGVLERIALSRRVRSEVEWRRSGAIGGILHIGRRSKGGARWAAKLASKLISGQNIRDVQSGSEIICGLKPTALAEELLYLWIERFSRDYSCQLRYKALRSVSCPSILERVVSLRGKQHRHYLLEADLLPLVRDCASSYPAETLSIVDDMIRSGSLRDSDAALQQVLVDGCFDSTSTGARLLWTASDFEKLLQLASEGRESARFFASVLRSVASTRAAGFDALHSREIEALALELALKGGDRGSAAASESSAAALALLVRLGQERILFERIDALPWLYEAWVENLVQSKASDADALVALIDLMNRHGAPPNCRAALSAAVRLLKGTAFTSVAREQVGRTVALDDLDLSRADSCETLIRVAVAAAAGVTSERVVLQLIEGVRAADEDRRKVLEVVLEMCPGKIQLDPLVVMSRLADVDTRKYRTVDYGEGEGRDFRTEGRLFDLSAVRHLAAMELTRRGESSR